MLNLKTRALLLLPILATACLAEGEDEPFWEGETTDAITNGSPAPNDRSVVLVYHQISDTSGALCTGTVISSRVVLTAAHCVPDKFQARVISLGYDGIKGPFIKIIDHKIHPFYNGGGKGNDIALLELEKPAGVPALRLNASPLDFDVTDRVRLLGYGDRDPGEANVVGLRFQGQGEVCQRMFNGNVVICPDDSTVLPGDSGGPTVARIGGVDKVVGVHSVVYLDGDGQPLASGDTAVDRHYGWILTNARLLEAF